MRCQLRRRGRRVHARTNETQRLARTQRAEREWQRRHAPLPRAELAHAQRGNVPSLAANGAARTDLRHRRRHRVAKLVREHLRRRLALFRQLIRGEHLESVGGQRRAAGTAVRARRVLQQCGGFRSEHARRGGQHDLRRNKNTRAANVGGGGARFAPDGNDGMVRRVGVRDGNAGEHRRRQIGQKAEQ